MCVCGTFLRRVREIRLRRILQRQRRTDPGLLTISSSLSDISTAARVSGLIAKFTNSSTQPENDNKAGFTLNAAILRRSSQLRHFFRSQSQLWFYSACCKHPIHIRRVLTLIHSCSICHLQSVTTQAHLTRCISRTTSDTYPRRPRPHRREEISAEWKKTLRVLLFGAWGQITTSIL